MSGSFEVKTLDRIDKEIYLGSYNQISNQIILTDPVFDYKPGSTSFFGGSFVTEIIPGPLHCYIIRTKFTFQKIQDKSIYNKTENTCLIVIHDNYKKIKPEWVFSTNVPVDTGTAGIFDLQYYQMNESGTELSEEWTDKVIQSIYSNRNEASILKHGVIFNINGGDGIYNGYTASSKGKVYALCIDTE